MYIAFSQRSDLNQHGDLMDNLEINYIDYFKKFGILPIVIPNTTKNLQSYFKELPIEAVILTGGNDINPELYGNQKTKESSISKSRDDTEKQLLKIAIKNNLPVLGICRGMQFINIFFGGKIIKIKEETDSKIEHVANNHQIKLIEKDTIDLFGKESEVNSYHNQGITSSNLSKELNVFATSEDGIIEAVYHKTLPIAAMQWHPERKSPDTLINEKIVKAFLKKEIFWKK